MVSDRQICKGFSDYWEPIVHKLENCENVDSCVLLIKILSEFSKEFSRETQYFVCKIAHRFFVKCSSVESHVALVEAAKHWGMFFFSFTDD